MFYELICLNFVLNVNKVHFEMLFLVSPPSSPFFAFCLSHKMVVIVRFPQKICTINNKHPPPLQILLHYSESQEMSPGSGLSNSCSDDGQSGVQGRGLFLGENNGRESVKVVGVYC